MKKIRRLLFILGITLLSWFFPSTIRADFIDDSLIPFWENRTVINESMLMTSYGGGTPEASFLFPPLNIISVKNSGLTTAYTEGQDWVLENGKLKLPSGSRIPFVQNTEIIPPTLNEGYYYHSKQIAVTYKHSTIWSGPVPQFADITSLPNTIRKLRNHEPLKIVTYGDSITQGGNASSQGNREPFLPTWAQLVTTKLQRHYKTTVTLKNAAVGGTTSTWGIDNIQSLVVNENPDLVIIAFGMNDGAGEFPVESFKTNILSMINKVKVANPKAEFILVNTMLAHPQSFANKSQLLYKPAIESLTSPGIVVADMTGVHQELLKTKKYADMTGNNINHPNDFLIRWYAQEILALLIPSIIGNIDSSNCTTISGWAGNTHTPDSSIYIHTYIDGVIVPQTSTDRLANLPREQAVCDALGSSQSPCTRGFRLNTPASIKDGKPHIINIYGINFYNNPKISNSGISITCPASPLTVGAIKFDAWVSAPNLESQDYTHYASGLWNDRLPFFTTYQNNLPFFAGDQQSVTNQEIVFAKRAGLSYFAFVYYPTEDQKWQGGVRPTLHYGLHNYLTSTQKNGLKFSLIIVNISNYVKPDLWHNSQVPAITSYVNNPNYQTVDSGRPLIYIFLPDFFPNFSTKEAALSAMNTLRQQITTATGKNPFIVGMDPSTDISYLGYDAISSYLGITGGGTTGAGSSYSQLQTLNRQRWDILGNTYAQIIPTVSVGYDMRPRLSPSQYGSNIWFQQPTPNQISEQLHSGLTWMKNNPTKISKANSIIFYAWNEYIEGGWIAPTLSENTARIDAVASILNPNPQIPGDLNGDSHVNIFDYNILVADFGNPYTIFDYNTLVSNYGK